MPTEKGSTLYVDSLEVTDRGDDLLSILDRDNNDKGCFMFLNKEQLDNLAMAWVKERGLLPEVARKQALETLEQTIKEVTKRFEE